MSARPPLPPHLRRMALALAVSAAAHGVLVGAIQVRPKAPPAADYVIHARLVAPPAPPAPVPAIPEAPAPLPETLPVPPRESPPPLPTTPAPAPLAAEPPPPAKPAPEPDAKPRAALEGGGVPLIFDANYYARKELDQGPRARGSIDPPYPEAAAVKSIEGEVKLELLVESDGQVNEARVVEANPEGWFEESALAAFRAARFEPAIKDGRPVRAKILILVRFELDSAAAAKARGQPKR